MIILQFITKHLSVSDSGCFVVALTVRCDPRACGDEDGMHRKSLTGASVMTAGDYKSPFSHHGVFLKCHRDSSSGSKRDRI